MEDQFTRDYKRLNPEQRSAVDAIDGPVMVIAGPGTGKTQILTLRIAHILQETDTAPESILALTFTEAGARAMQERLRTYIGNRAHKVEIHTFHEFAGMLIRSYPDAYVRAVGGRTITDLEKVECITRALETPTIKLLRPRGNPEYYVSKISSAITELKREYITPDTFAESIIQQEVRLRDIPQFHEKGPHKGKVRKAYQDADRDVIKNKELLFVYRAYDAFLAQEHLYDYEDMILETVEALERNEDMLRDVQERFQYLLADEHQDVNGSQNRILELIASFHERPNLFVVGDEKQAIYRFQGASLENFLYFGEKFPHVKTIALTENYRSTQSILDLAHAVITEEDSPAAQLRVSLNAVTQEVGSIEWRSYTHEAIEEDACVARIRELVQHVPPHEIAVIVRKNKEVEHFARLLRLAGIPADASADSNILEHPITASVRSLITVLLEPSNEEALFVVLHEPYWNIESEDLFKVVSERSHTRPLSALISDSDFLTALHLRAPERVMQVALVLKDIRAQISTTAPHWLLAQALTMSGFVDHIMVHDPLDGGRALRRLYDEIESLVRAHEAVTLRDVARMFSLRIAHKLSLNAPYIPTGARAVQVMTAHKSKGLEFEHVFIPHLTKKVWEDTKNKNSFALPIGSRFLDASFDKLDDERKILYVALTRAKKGLYLSYSTKNLEGGDLSETQLVSEVREAHGVIVPTVTDEETFNPLSIFTKTPNVSIEKELLVHTLRQRGLSATSLNNYLQSPWNYLYRNVLRIPEVKSESAEFGTVIHETLASITQHHREKGKFPTVTECTKFLERALAKLPLNVNAYTRFHEQGLATITTYLAHMQTTLPLHTREEVRLDVMLPTGDPEFPEIRLTGALDRLDFDRAPHDGGRLIRVIDYKTGNPKTRGVIEGTTKDSDGGYKRQLVFYALMLSLQNDERMKTYEFVLSFVEADKKGVIHEEAYTITDGEISALTEEVIRVAHEIRTGAFLSKICDPKESDYCHLAARLQGI